MISPKKKIFLMICVCLGGYFLFGKLVSEILEGESHIIDTKILMFMRDPSDRNVLWGPGWFQEMMRDITGLGGIGILTLITIACAIYFFIIRKANLAFYILVSVGTGVLFSNFLKSYFDRPRPDLVPYGSIIYTASLPSGHALMSAVVYLTLGAIIAETQSSRSVKIYILSIATMISVLVGISRVYLGVHWPSDVLAGWLAGVSWALMFWLVVHYSRNIKIKDCEHH